MTLAWIGLGANLGDAAATVGAAIGFGLQQPFIAFPLWALLQGAAAWAAARDPWFLDTWPRHLAKPAYLGA